MNRPPLRRLTASALAVFALAASSAGCASTGGTAPARAASYAVWDPYPQFGSGSPWAELLTSCGRKAGVRIVRTSYQTGSMVEMADAVPKGEAQADVLIVDNPAVATLAVQKRLATTRRTGVDTSSVEPNLLAAGQVDGSTYGVPIGANTLALYYNKAILRAAGVDPSTLTDWAALTDALARVTASGRKGIAFAAIASEEGSFQFLPWFWGSGAHLTDLASPQAASALALWTTWYRKGYTAPTVLTDTQETSWGDFESGTYAFAENGTWQLTPAGKLPFGYGIIPLPSENGGTAPVPLGGEFVTQPVQQDTSRYATSATIVACLTSAKNSYATDSTLSYVAPTAAVQARQVAANPGLNVWVRAVHSARGRTSDNLGDRYPAISLRLSAALEVSLGGFQTPQAALAAAQSAAQSK